MTVYTNHFRDHVLAASAPKVPVLVCGQGLPDFDTDSPRSSQLTIGFVGRDFSRKGGDIAVKAFALLRRTHPGLKMILITRATAVDQQSLPDGVEFFPDQPRSAIRSRLLPRMDVLMLPTAADCGAPYGVLEALQIGVPVVTSTLPWLDDRLRAPAVHRVPRTASAVAAAVATLLEPTALQTAREAARGLWHAEFSMSELHGQLLRAYRTAMFGASSP